MLGQRRKEAHVFMCLVTQDTVSPLYTALTLTASVTSDLIDAHFLLDRWRLCGSSLSPEPADLARSCLRGSYFCAIYTFNISALSFQSARVYSPRQQKVSQVVLCGAERVLTDWESQFGRSVLIETGPATPALPRTCCGVKAVTLFPLVLIKEWRNVGPVQRKHE